MLVKVKRGIRTESNFLKSFRSERRKWLDYRKRGLFYALQSWCRMPHDPVSFRPDYSSLPKRSHKWKREASKRCENSFHDLGDINESRNTKIEINTRLQTNPSQETSFDPSSQFPLTFWSYGRRKDVKYEPSVDVKSKKRELPDHFPRFQFCSGCSRRAEYHFHEDRKRRLGGGFAYIRKDYKLWVDLLSGVRGWNSFSEANWQNRDDGIDAVLIESDSLKPRSGKLPQEKSIPPILPPISENIDGEASGLHTGDEDLIVDPFVQYSTETGVEGQRYVVIIRRDGEKKQIPIVEENTEEVQPRVDTPRETKRQEADREIDESSDNTKKSEAKNEPSIDHTIPMKPIKARERKLMIKREQTHPKKRPVKPGKTEKRDGNAEALQLETVVAKHDLQLPEAPICQLHSTEVVSSGPDMVLPKHSRDQIKSSSDFSPSPICVIKSPSMEKPENSLPVKSTTFEASADEQMDKTLDDSAVEKENENKTESGIPEKGESSPSEDVNRMSETICDLPSEKNIPMERESENGDENNIKSPKETLVARIAAEEEEEEVMVENESNEDRNSESDDQQKKFADQEALMEAKLREMKRKYAKRSTRSESQSIVPSQHGSEILQIDEILSMADPYDWLSKYCIINPDRLPLYSRVFEKALASKNCPPTPSSSSPSSASPRTTHEEKHSSGKKEERPTMRMLSPMKNLKQKTIKLATLRDPSRNNPILAQSGKSNAQLMLDSIELTMNNLNGQVVNLENELRNVTAAKKEFLESNPDLVQIIEQLSKKKKKKIKKKGKDKKSSNKEKNNKKIKSEAKQSPVEELDPELLEDLKMVEGKIDYLKERIRDAHGRMRELNEEEIWWKIVKEQEDLEDELAYVGMEHLLADQTGISEAIHPAYNPEIDVPQMEAGLRSINGQLMTRKEFQYIYHVLRILPGRTRIDKKMFCVVAALSEKVSQLDHFTKKLINKQDFDALTAKTWKAKELFHLMDVDDDSCTPESLLIELNAGGLTKEHVKIVHDKLTRLKTGRVTFLDYLTYLPLFLEIHTRILDNPLTSARDL